LTDKRKVTINVHSVLNLHTNFLKKYLHNVITLFEERQSILAYGFIFIVNMYSNIKKSIL